MLTLSGDECLGLSGCSTAPSHQAPDLDARPRHAHRRHSGHPGRPNFQTPSRIQNGLPGAPHTPMGGGQPQGWVPPRHLCSADFDKGRQTAQSPEMPKGRPFLFAVEASAPGRSTDHGRPAGLGPQAFKWLSLATYRASPFPTYSKTGVSSDVSTRSKMAVFHLNPRNAQFN